MNELTLKLDKRRIKLARITSVPFVFIHIERQICYLKDLGFDISLVSSPGKQAQIINERVGLPIKEIEIPRKISIFKDLVSLFRLYKYLKKEKFDIVHSHTPKAGLLVAISSWLAGVPIRLHTFTGQRWVTTKGLLRFVLKWCDRIIGFINTHVYADSKTQIDFLVKKRIVSKSAISLIHKGSLGGVDEEKFNPEKHDRGHCFKNLGLNLQEDSLKIIYVGRITREKGIVELIETFDYLTGKCGKKLDLILVGFFEMELDPLPVHVLDIIHYHPRISHVGFSAEPEKYLAAADVFCIPSYREGFSSVILEAAAMGLPTIGTRIPGIVDPIVDGETGLLVEARDKKGLEEAIMRFYNNSSLIQQYGENARRRALDCFGYRIIAQKQAEEYCRLTSEFDKRVGKRKMFL